MNSRAVGYIRVSTERQAEEGVSLDAQERKIQAWCELNGYDLEEVFIDRGLSGGRADNRPELQSAIKSITSKPGALVVYSLSRLARSTRDTLAIADRLERAGADLVSLSEKIDTTSAAGKMVFRMLAVLSEFERDLVSERTSHALQHKRSLGERVGQIPFGFVLDNDGVHLLEAPKEQDLIQCIVDMRGEGRSYRRIADALNAQPVTPKSGGMWYASTVREVCRRSGA